jgi:hypothetical protein
MGGWCEVNDLSMIIELVSSDTLLFSLQPHPTGSGFTEKTPRYRRKSHLLRCLKSFYWGEAARTGLTRQPQPVQLYKKDGRVSVAGRVPLAGMVLLWVVYPPFIG